MKKLGFFKSKVYLWENEEKQTQFSQHRFLIRFVH